MVRWGILSTARINDKFLAGCSVTDAVAVVAVASRDAERARAYADERGIERAHGSYEALLADPEVEAVYVPLPNSMHLEWSERALLAGKHVLCEKPLGRNPDRVAAAFDLADREGRLLMEAFMYRHHAQTQRLQQLISEGAIGRLRVIRASFSFLATDPTDVRLAAKRLALAERDELEVVGEHGALFLDDPWHCREPSIEVRSGGQSRLIELSRANPYTLEAENFSRAIRGEEQPLLGRDDAVGQAATIDALYRATTSAGTSVTDVEEG